MKPRHLISALLGALLLGYLLSIGPVSRYFYRRDGRVWWELPFYSPLEYIARELYPLGQPLIWYGRLWLPPEAIPKLGD